MKKTDLKKVIEAIRSETGIDFPLLLSKARAQELVYARIFFANILNKNYGQDEIEIAKLLRLDKASVIHYMRLFEDEIKYNVDFRTQYNDILRKLSPVKTSVNSIKDTAFMQVCEKETGYRPVQEFKFHKTRRWRFDFAIPDKKVAIEKEGGIWTRGRHTRPTGFINDMEKYNTAAAMGWAVIRVTPQDIASEKSIELVKQAVDRFCANDN